MAATEQALLALFDNQSLGVDGADLGRLSQALYTLYDRAYAQGVLFGMANGYWIEARLREAAQAEGVPMMTPRGPIEPWEEPWQEDEEDEAGELWPGAEVKVGP